MKAILFAIFAATLNLSQAALLQDSIQGGLNCTPYQKNCAGVCYPVQIPCPQVEKSNESQGGLNCPSYQRDCDGVCYPIRLPCPQVEKSQRDVDCPPYEWDCNGVCISVRFVCN